MKKSLQIVLSLICIFALILSLSSPVLAAKKKDKEETTKEAEEIVLTEEEKAMVMSMIYEADISTLRELINKGYLSCRELTEYYVERINKYNEDYNCFITLCTEEALKKADECDAALKAGPQSGLLFGIPVVIKDNMDYAGYKTSNGLALSSVSEEKESAYVVKRLLDEGAIIIGKTNMSTQAQAAYASISVAAGETLNAYSTQLSPGGSSGGTASSVSLNFAAAGLGTDTNSSLRIPAAFNGCTAIRSTFGLISTDGIDKLNPARDVAGALARTVADEAIMMDVLTDKKYSYYDKLDANALKGAKLGLVTSFTYADKVNNLGSKIDSEIAAAFEKAVEELKSCGAEIVEISMNNAYSYRWSCAENKTGSSEKKAAFYSEFQKLMKDNNFDALIFPSYLSTPLSSGYSGGAPTASRETFVNNSYYFSPILGTPEITVQIGNHSKGAGIAMEMVADKNQEQVLLNLAYSYQKNYNHRVSTAANAPDLHAASGDYTVKDLENVINERLNPTVEKTETVKETKKNTDVGKFISVFSALVIVFFILAVAVICNIPKKRQ